MRHRFSQAADCELPTRGPIQYMQFPGRVIITHTRMRNEGYQARPPLIRVYQGLRKLHDFGMAARGDPISFRAYICLGDPNG